MAWAIASRGKNLLTASRRLVAAPLRSLTLKLTLAFALVGLIGVLLVTLMIALRTRAEFNRFLSTRDQTILLDALRDYYAKQGGWQGVEGMLAENPQLLFYSRSIALADAQGTIVLGHPIIRANKQLSSEQIGQSTPVQVNDQLAGYMLVLNRSAGLGGAGGPAPPEIAFLQRVTWASAISGLFAVLIAVLLGVLLARSLTRPIRELTLATQAMAGGQLDQQVVVRSRDDIGVLAASFNHMSADLARASTLRKQMTADLAHDLRTPLSILRGYTEGLMDERLRGTPAIFSLMHGEVEHLQHLVEDLRVLSLADAGELPLNRRVVDPSALLERTGLAYFVQAEGQGIRLSVEAGEQLPSIAVDTDRMTQVLNNLVSNALRYTPVGGTIALRASSECQDLSFESDAASRATQNSKLKTQNFVVLQVSDTGSGIAAEDLPFVFERFYRADKARQRSDTSGLGLAIARAIVEAHHGAIAVDSAPGQGTTFTVTLPIASEGEP